MSCGRTWLTVCQDRSEPRPPTARLFHSEEGTLRDEDSHHTRRGAEQQGAAERPPSAETVHGDPGEAVARNLNKTHEGEVQVPVATQTGRVH